MPGTETVRLRAIITETVRRRTAIAGRVTDFVTGQAIAGAIVELEGTKLRTQAGRDGFFHFVDLQKGAYTLIVSVPRAGSRYQTKEIEDVKVEDGPDGRPILDSKASVALSPTRLTGRVKGVRDGQPIEGAVVKLVGSEEKTLTDKEGKYMLSGLQACKPNVQVYSEGHVSKTMTVQLRAGQEGSADFGLEQI